MKKPVLPTAIQRLMPILILISVVLGMWASSLSIKSYYEAHKKAKQQAA